LADDVNGTAEKDMQQTSALK